MGAGVVRLNYYHYGSGDCVRQTHQGSCFGERNNNYNSLFRVSLTHYPHAEFSASKLSGLALNFT